MQAKVSTPTEFKVVDEDKGLVDAVFSTLKVIDKDGDVTLPGAFGNQEVRISAFNHQSWGGELPVGKGSIQEKGDEAVLSSQFFMNTTKGRDTFQVIKELGPLMEWSYGFDILEKSEGKWPEGDENGQDVRFLKKLKVHEVSPVILGAGENTRTLSAKFGKQSYGLSDDEAIAARATLLAAMAVLGETPDEDDDLSDILDLLRISLNIPDPDDTEDTRLGDVMEPMAAGRGKPGGLKLQNHLVIVESIMDTIVSRVAEAVAMRTEKGERLSEETYELVQKILSQEKRLREAVAIEPRTNPSQQQLTESIFRDARSLLLLTGGTDGS